MGFGITKCVAFIAFIAFASRYVIDNITSTQHTCEIKYYGFPKFNVIASDILQMQMTSYQENNNYERMIRTYADKYENKRYVINNNDLYGPIKETNIFYDIKNYGSYVLDGGCTKDDAIRMISEELKKKYNETNMQNIRLHWEYLDSQGNITCDETFEIEKNNNVSYVPGDTMICYINVPNFLRRTKHCNMSFNFEHQNITKFVPLLTRIYKTCTGIIFFVAILAMSSRIVKKIKHHNLQRDEKFINNE